MKESEMATTWESLDRSQQLALCRQLGARTPEDHNRIAEYLSQNPKAVEEALKESGNEETTEPQDNPQEESVEGNVDKALADEGSTTEQGAYAPSTERTDIPPAEPGESVEDYIKRLSGLVRG